jgi:hypothetical protein
MLSLHGKSDGGELRIVVYINRVTCGYRLHSMTESSIRSLLANSREKMGLGILDAPAGFLVCLLLRLVSLDGRELYPLAIQQRRA